MRARLVPLAAALPALLVGGAAAGGGPATMDSILARRGPDVALVLGTSDYARGPVRVSFLVVANDGKAVERPRAHVWVGTGRDVRPVVETTAVLEPVGVPGASEGADGDVSHLYVASFRLPRAGKYLIVAEPDGEQIQGYQYLDVKARASAPAVGSKAYPSKTPTLASVHGKAAQLTTRVPPDRALLRYSVADTLKAHRPFVLVFATPKFCTSRTCGPVVDVVDAVRKRYESRGIRFIHVEIYDHNDPSRGPNRWVREWRLPSEPWIFLVGRDGRVAAKFEGSISVQELGAAVRTTLLR
jgi:hypothetical protein